MRKVNEHQLKTVIRKVCAVDKAVRRMVLTELATWILSELLELKLL